MIYITNNDDEINVICDFDRLGINPNQVRNKNYIKDVILGLYSNFLRNVKGPTRKARILNGVHKSKLPTLGNRCLE